MQGKYKLPAQFIILTTGAAFSAPFVRIKSYNIHFRFIAQFSTMFIWGVLYSQGTLFLAKGDDAIKYQHFRAYMHGEHVSTSWDEDDGTIWATQSSVI